MWYEVGVLLRAKIRFGLNGGDSVDKVDFVAIVAIPWYGEKGARGWIIDYFGALSMCHGRYRTKSVSLLAILVTLD